MALIADMNDLLSGSNVLLVGLILVIAVLMLRAQRYLGRRQRTVVRRPDRASKSPPAVPAHVDLPEQAQRWEVEMHELARDLSARIDSKMSALQSLILAADERIRRLESVVPQAPPETPLDNRGSTGNEHPRLETYADEMGKAQAPAPGDLSRGTVATGKVRTQADALSAAKASMSDDAPEIKLTSAPRRDHKIIYELADAGVPATAIAAQIGTPIGEVELVLSLRGNQ